MLTNIMAEEQIERQNGVLLVEHPHVGSVRFLAFNKYWAKDFARCIVCVYDGWVLPIPARVTPHDKGQEATALQEKHECEQCE